MQYSIQKNISLNTKENNMRTIYSDQAMASVTTRLSKMSQSFDSCLNKISGENQRVFGTENFKELQ